jgi:hypothetical protein
VREQWETSNVVQVPVSKNDRIQLSFDLRFTPVLLRFLSASLEKPAVD